MKMLCALLGQPAMVRETDRLPSRFKHHEKMRVLSSPVAFSRPHASLPTIDMDAKIVIFYSERPVQGAMPWADVPRPFMLDVSGLTPEETTRLLAEINAPT